MEMFNKLNDWMIAKFKENGVTIEKTYFCPHKPEDHCFCRKPNPGLILNAIHEFQIDPKESIMIGDKNSDIQAAKNAGIPRTFLFSGNEHFSTIFEINSFITGDKYGK